MHACMHTYTLNTICIYIYIELFTMYTNIVKVSGQVEVTMFRPPVLEPFFVVAGRAERFRPASRQRIWFFFGGKPWETNGET